MRLLLTIGCFQIMTSSITPALQQFLQPFTASAEHPGARFGHIRVPPYNVIQEDLIGSIRKVCLDSGCIKTPYFVVSDPRTVTKLANSGEGGKVPSVVRTFPRLVDTLRTSRKDGNQKGWMSGEGVTARADDEPVTDVLPRSIIMVMWLDPEMSADCALAVAGVVKWATVVSSSEPSADISIVTMAVAQEENNLLSDVVTAVGSIAKVNHLDLAALAEQNPVVDNVIFCNHDVRKAFGIIKKACQDAPEARRLVITFDDQFYGAMQKHCAGQGWEFIKYIRVTPDSSEQLLEGMKKSFNSSKTLVVTFPFKHPIVPCELAELDEFYVVPGCHVQNAEVWDEDCVQVITKSRQTSEEERRRQLWWCRQPSTKYKTVFIPAATVDLFLQGTLYPRLVENAHLGGFVAAVVDLASWNIDSAKILSCFVRYSLRAREMLERLSVHGITSGHGLGLSLKEAQIFRGMLSCFDYDYRLALLVALGSDPVLCNIKVHLAVLLKYGALDLVYLQDQTTESVSSRRNKVFQESGKTCQHLRYDGPIWLVLGLLGHGSVETDKAVKSLFLINKMRLNHRSACVTKALTTLNKLGFHNIEMGATWKFDELTRVQEDQLRSHLLRAYIFQLAVLSPNKTDRQDTSKNNASLTFLSRYTQCGLLEAKPQSVASLYESSHLTNRDREMAFVVAFNLQRSQDNKLSCGFWVCFHRDLITQWWQLQKLPQKTLSELLSTEINYT